MITDDRMGVPGAISIAGLSVFRVSALGVDGNRPTLFDLSISRMCFVASRPFITGNWISIWGKRIKWGLAMPSSSDLLE